MEVQAASLCYNANISIYQSGQPTWRVINFTPTDCHKCLHLSYHDGDHYNSVRREDDTGNGPAEAISLRAYYKHATNEPAVSEPTVWLCTCVIAHARLVRA